MKFPILLSLLLLFCISCENRSGSTQTSTTRSIEKRSYPAAMAAIFKAHGGLDRWNAMNNSCFEVAVDSGIEVHTVDLSKRKILIEAADYKLGFDGDNVWVSDNDNKFMGDPAFYYNNLFYFSAMPLIFSDPGVIFTERKDEVLKGKRYGVIHIGFRRNTGDSPQDEYMVYYNKDSFKMEWLGYTVTYYERKKSNDWNFIHFDSWQDINEFLLPKKITWFNKTEGKPGSPTSSTTFSEYTITETTLPDSVFEVPDDSELIKYK